jgi:hypothetical protein
MVDFRDRLLALPKKTRDQLISQTNELRKFKPRPEYQSGTTVIRDYFQRLYDIDVANGLQKGDRSESLFENIIPKDLIKEFNLPSLSYDSLPAGDPTPYIREVAERITQLTTEQYSRFVEKLSRPVHSMDRANRAFETANEYYSEVDEKMKAGDAVQTHTVSRCPGVDMSGSPYEIAKRSWLAIINGGSSLTLNLTPVYTAVKPLLGKDTDSYINKLTQDFNEYMSAGFLDPDLFKRDEPLASGTPVVLDLGTENGTYGEYQKTIDELDKANYMAGGLDPTRKYNSLSEYLNSKISMFNPPAEIFYLLNNTLDEEEKPLATDGKPLDYDFIGIDPDPNSRKPALLSPQEKKEISEFMSKLSIESLNNFNDEYSKLKDEHAKKNFLYKMKPVVLTNVLVAIGAMEIEKWGKVLSKLENIRSTGVIPDFNTFTKAFHDTTHSISVVQGWLEGVLNVYKLVTNITNGKYGDAVRDGLFGAIGAVTEFGLGNETIKNAVKALFPNLVEMGATGYIGIGLTLFSTLIDYGIRPLVKKKNEKMINDLLDAERMWLEKECCQKFHPELYRKTRGQALIPVVADTAANSIDGVKIPIGPSPKRGYDPDFLNSKPCQPPRINEKQEYIGLYRQSSSLRTEPGQGNVILGAPKMIPFNPNDKSTNKCNKPAQLRGIEVSPTSNLLLHEAIPAWSKQTEKDYQSGIFSYNLNYVVNSYLGKIREADCRIGKLTNDDGTGGGGSIDYQNGGKIPLDSGGDTTLGSVGYGRRIVYYRERLDTPIASNPDVKYETWVSFWDGSGFRADLDWREKFGLPTGGIVKLKKPV